MTPSCHHCLGLPSGLFPIGFKSNSFLVGLAWSILCIRLSHLILCALMNLTISAPSINLSISMLFRVLHILPILTVPNLLRDIIMPFIIKTNNVTVVQKHRRCQFLVYFPLLKKNVLLLHNVTKTLNYVGLQAAASADEVLTLLGGFVG